eukprot:765770-Hanusia_phi.AAC.5
MLSASRCEHKPACQFSAKVSVFFQKVMPLFLNCPAVVFERNNSVVQPRDFSLKILHIISAPHSSDEHDILFSDRKHIVQILTGELSLRASWNQIFPLKIHLSIINMGA